MVLSLSRARRYAAWMCSRRGAWMVMVLACGLFWGLMGMVVTLWLLTVEEGYVTFVLAPLLIVAVVLIGVQYPALRDAITRYRVRQLRRALARGDIRAWYQPRVTGAQGHRGTSVGVRYWRVGICPAGVFVAQTGLLPWRKTAA